MKRIYYMIFRNFIRFPYLYFKLIYMVKSGKYNDEERYEFLKKIVYYANRGGNVKIVSTGEELLPENGNYILYPNHQGMYDVLTIIATHKKHFSVVIKKELANIPLLKWIFRAFGYLAMDRDDLKQSLGVIKEVTRQVQEEGRNYLIFAEGTRSKNGNQVGEMKGGSFKSATRAKCPIVPVALIDAFKPFDTNSISPVTVQVHYLQPLYYEEYTDLKTTEIAEIVRERIVQAIKDHSGQEAQ